MVSTGHLLLWVTGERRRATEGMMDEHTDKGQGQWNDGRIFVLCVWIRFSNVPTSRT